MLFSINHRTVIPLVFLFLGQSPLWAASARSLALAPESTVKLDGDSTLHPFFSQTNQIQLTTELVSSTTDAFTPILQENALKRFAVSIPVISLKSKESGLDKNMYKALKAKDCPTIDYAMKSYEVGTSTNTTLPVKVIGTLRISCREQPVTLDGTIIPESGALHVQGTYPLLMSDYGVKPPTMMMGAIKVKDKVVISYNLHLTPD